MYLSQPLLRVLRRRWPPADEGELLRGQLEEFIATGRQPLGGGWRLGAACRQLEGADVGPLDFQRQRRAVGAVRYHQDGLAEAIARREHNRRRDDDLDLQEEMPPVVVSTNKDLTLFRTGKTLV